MFNTWSKGFPPLPPAPIKAYVALSWLEFKNSRIVMFESKLNEKFVKKKSPPPSVIPPLQEIEETNVRNNKDIPIKIINLLLFIFNTII